MKTRYLSSPWVSLAAEATNAAAAANSLSVAQANINKQTRAATERSKNLLGIAIDVMKQARYSGRRT